MRRLHAAYALTVRSKSVACKHTGSLTQTHTVVLQLSYDAGASAKRITARTVVVWCATTHACSLLSSAACRSTATLLLVASSSSSSVTRLAVSAAVCSCCCSCCTFASRACWSVCALRVLLSYDCRRSSNFCSYMHASTRTTQAQTLATKSVLY
jgi:hypothetical protein